MSGKCLSIYERLFEQVRDCIMFFNLEGRILEVNTAALHTYGYTWHEMTSMNIRQIRVPETLHLVDSQLQRAVAGGVLFETLHCRKDGTVFPVEVNATVAEFGGEKVILSVVRDISKRIDADMTLRKLSTAVEQSPASIVITDLDGNITYVNPKFTAATGYTLAEALGQNPRILKSGHQPPEVYEELWRTISSGKEWRGEFQNKCKDGTIVWEWASISPIRDASGQATHYLAVKEDITVRKLTEDRMRRDMEIASRIQRSFLPAPFDSGLLSIRTLYEPHRHVGGDLFDYFWDESAYTLSGYLADVMGHGVGTALQASALRVLFRQAAGDRLSPGQTMRWINAQAPLYFAEDTFAAAVFFQFDFRRQIATVSVAGINHFFAWNQQHTGLITKPGIYLGLVTNADFEEHKISYQSGDCFLFLTDGLLDLLTDRSRFASSDPETAWTILRNVTAEQKALDDASAIQITIK